jgi:hypothetical protein
MAGAGKWGASLWILEHEPHPHIYSMYNILILIELNDEGYSIRTEAAE